MKDSVWKSEGKAFRLWSWLGRGRVGVGLRGGNRFFFRRGRVSLGGMDGRRGVRGLVLGFGRGGMVRLVGLVVLGGW